MAVNHSEGQICHLERDRRTPDLATLVALFVPALELEDAPDDTVQLLALAAASRTPALAEESDAAADMGKASAPPPRGHPRVADAADRAGRAAGCDQRRCSPCRMCGSSP